MLNDSDDGVQHGRALDYVISRRLLTAATYVQS
jgi:hypothetical protein